MGNASAKRIPLPVKLAFTAFMAVLVPSYWYAYGPTNFLYFCDVALFFTLVAVWTEVPLLAGMPTVGILVPQLFWVVDFLARCFGGHITGMTDYMFDAKLSLFTRGLSLFHGWLPFFLVYLVWRLGYDRRSLVAWTLLAWVLLLVCYFFLPPAPTDAAHRVANVNYVFGLSETKPQMWMPPLLWLAGMMVILPIAFFLPAHIALCFFPARRRPLPSGPETKTR